MTPHQVQLVQDSFQAVVPIRNAAASIFYERLFARDPALWDMFQNTDMTAQGDKLMATLGFVVKGLTRPDTILPAVQSLGRRHRGYGVEDRQYNTVGLALIDTLSAGLGAAFTDETRGAWVAAYALLSEAMIAASSEAEAAAAPTQPTPQAA